MLRGDGSAVPFWASCSPREPPGIYPASAESIDPLAIAAPIRIVVVAADVDGPFKSVSLELDGKPLPLERWGDYFFIAKISPAEIAATGGTLVLEAANVMSAVQSVQLPIGKQR